MTRVLSGAALIALAIAVVWSNQRLVFEVVAFVLLFAATYELVTPVPRRRHCRAAVAGDDRVAADAGDVFRILGANFPSDDRCRADGRR